MSEKIIALEKSVDNAILAFDSIKIAIADTGVEIAETPVNDYAAKIAEVYDTARQAGEEAGRQAGYWSGLQEDGERANYDHVFSGAKWNNETFKPRYDIVPKSANYMFYQSHIEGDMVALLEELGITIDLSQLPDDPDNPGLQYAFAEMPYVTRIGRVGANVDTADYMFYGSANLQTIDCLVLAGRMLNSFKGCTSLANITIEGQALVTMDFGDCPLTHNSAMSVIGSLYNWGASSTVKPLLTFSPTTYATLTADEIAIATSKGWTVTQAEVT